MASVFSAAQPSLEQQCKVVLQKFPCYCPDGWQMDALATACLDKKEIKANLKLILALLPTELKTQLVSKVQHAARQCLAYSPTFDLQTLGLAFAADHEDIANYLAVASTTVRNSARQKAAGRCAACF